MNHAFNLSPPTMSFMYICQGACVIYIKMHCTRVQSLHMTQELKTLGQTDISTTCRADKHNTQENKGQQTTTAQNTTVIIENQYNSVPDTKKFPIIQLLPTHPPSRLYTRQSAIVPTLQCQIKLMYCCCVRPDLQKNNMETRRTKESIDVSEMHFLL